MLKSAEWLRRSTAGILKPRRKRSWCIFWWEFGTERYSCIWGGFMALTSVCVHCGEGCLNWTWEGTMLARGCWEKLGCSTVWGTREIGQRRLTYSGWGFWCGKTRVLGEWGQEVRDSPRITRLNSKQPVQDHIHLRPQWFLSLSRWQEAKSSNVGASVKTYRETSCFVSCSRRRLLLYHQQMPP